MLIVAIFFIVLAVVVKYGKLYFLIAGYNTMSNEEREKYDIKAIANLFANVMYVMALFLIIGHILTKWYANPSIQNIVFWITLFSGVIYLIVKSNSKKFKN